MCVKQERNNNTQLLKVLNLKKKTIFSQYNNYILRIELFVLFYHITRSVAKYPPVTLKSIILMSFATSHVCARATYIYMYVPKSLFKSTSFSNCQSESESYS